MTAVRSATREWDTRPLGQRLGSGSSAPSPNFARYRPDIDGLRAIAVVAVVLYHAFPATLTGGFVGVDVFFVISGFLISGIIFSSLDRGQFSFVAFYGRRARRIFPALFLVLLFCLAYGFIVLLPAEFAQLGKEIAAGVGFVSNLVLWNESGYFDGAMVSKPLLHLWSLGVEEQFYIFWPLAAWIVYRAGLSRIAFVATIAAASFCLNVVLSSDDMTADFYSPLSRFWELAAGAMLAWPTLRPSPRVHEVMCKFQARGASLRSMASIVGLAMIIGAALLFNRHMRFPGWAAVLPTSGAAVLIATGPSALVNRVVLSNRLAVFTGLISYPLYLWHWPLISYAYILRLGRTPRPLLAVGLVAVSFLLAWMTYRLVETPVRFGNRRRGNTIALIASMGLMGVAGTAAWLTNGFGFRYPDLPNINIAKISTAVGEGFFRPTKDMRVNKVKKIIVAVIGDGKDAVLLTGDSLMYHYGARVQELLDDGRLTKTVYFVVGPSCTPIPGIIKSGPFAHCSEMPKIAADLIDTKHIGTVVFGGSWPEYQGDDIYVERGGVRLPIDSPEAVNDVYANLEDETRRLVRTNHSVYLILNPPVSDRFDPRRMISRSLTGFRIDPAVLEGVPIPDLVARAADVDRRLIDIAERTGARTVDPLSDICGAGPTCSSFFADGEPKFVDSMHLRPAYVRNNITFLDNLLTR